MEICAIQHIHKWSENTKVNSEGTKSADGTKLLRKVKRKARYGMLRKIL